jgi:hypothetical protein
MTLRVRVCCASNLTWPEICPHVSDQSDQADHSQSKAAWERVLFNFFNSAAVSFFKGFSMIRVVVVVVPPAFLKLTATFDKYGGGAGGGAFGVGFSGGGGGAGVGAGGGCFNGTVFCLGAGMGA